MSKKIRIDSNISIKEYILKNKIVLGVVTASIFFNIYLLSIPTPIEKDTVEENQSLYKYISKRVFVEDPNDVIINFVPLRIALREYVTKQGDNLGVYFEYLPSGISIGVNDRNEFKLASLSKVPLVMSVLKKIEKGEIKLTDTVQLHKDDLNDSFGDLWKRGEGATLSIEELIQASLIYSDNTAYHTLFRLLTNNEIIDVYDNLEIEVSSKETNPQVSPKSYSSIFRSLYLASYLSKENSNYILDTLTKTIFNDKIPAGLPANIPVAHKIGVFSIPESPEKVFTDCGIVYAPQRPYVLCIFVKESEEDARKHSVYISKMIYQYIQIVKGGNK